MIHRDSNSPDVPDKHGRKRVGKACDRCRQKKSKCDGSHPCNRCRADNQQCIFGERKRAPDKVHPKGYTEKLESDNKRLTDGLWELYKLTLNHDIWPGDPVGRDGDNPMTHEILARIGVLQHHSSPPTPEMLDYDEFPSGQGHRRQSFSSDSDHSSSPSSRNSSLKTPLDRPLFAPDVATSGVDQSTIDQLRARVVNRGPSIQQTEDFFQGNTFGSRPFIQSDLSMFMPVASPMEDLKSIDPQSTFGAFSNSINDFMYNDPVLPPNDIATMDMLEDSEPLWGQSRR